MIAVLHVVTARIHETVALHAVTVRTTVLLHALTVVMTVVLHAKNAVAVSFPQRVVPTVNRLTVKVTVNDSLHTRTTSNHCVVAREKNFN
jgi:hypothetical protein